MNDRCYAAPGGGRLKSVASPLTVQKSDRKSLLSPLVNEQLAAAEISEGHALPMRGSSQLIIPPVWVAAAGRDSLHRLLSKGLACSSVCRLSFGRDIHSRMIFRRAS